MRLLYSYKFSLFLGPYSSFDSHANLSNVRLYAIPQKICQRAHFLDLINAWCWREDCEVLIHDGEAGVD